MNFLKFLKFTFQEKYFQLKTENVGKFKKSFDVEFARDEIVAPLAQSSTAINMR